MIDSLFNVFAPHRCSSCGQIGVILCEGCKNNIINESFSWCLFCQKPCGDSGICAVCQQNSPFEQAWCVGERTGALKGLLDGYKFQSQRAGARILAELLDSLLPILPPDTTLVGVPTSRHTVRVRGFDHVGLVVRELARLRGLEVAAPLRRESSATLHFLPLKERKKLGPSLFSLSAESVPATVLLVDDILTTGTTLHAAGSLLKRAGVKHLYVAVVARQPEG